ncbi:MAG: proline dehydrogenase family protein [Acidobacteria bacterium]|nr:proline dehydrogenase family protein [Acidobacteriota bacterium]
MILRSSLLYLSRQKSLRSWMETSPLARKLTQRFVAGQTLEEELAVCRRLNSAGHMVTLDHLGEAVTSREEAAAACEAYLEALDRIGAEKLRATVSIKLSQFGISEFEAQARESVHRVAARAQEVGTGLEIDMEEASSVDRTLQLVSEVHAARGNVRAVIQAYLRRSQADVERLCAERIPVRLCKGAYEEPAAVAFPTRPEVDRNYLRLTGLLLKAGVNPGIATHDPKMVGGAMAAAVAYGVARDGFEFQMLYGIRRDVQRKLLAEGYRLRLYVPYGDAWYPYFMRRLAERPANVLFLARNLARR